MNILYTVYARFDIYNSWTTIKLNDVCQLFCPITYSTTDDNTNAMHIIGVTADSWKTLLSGSCFPYKAGYLALPRVYGRDSIDSACVFYFSHKITHWSRHIRFYTRYLSVMARRIYPIDDLFYSYIARDTRADGMRTHRVMNWIKKKNNLEF